MPRVLCFLLLSCALTTAAQPSSTTPLPTGEGLGERLTLMEWNVENLFHPSNDPLTADDDFTPEGKYRWTYGRFMHKLNGIAQTIAAACTDLDSACRPSLPDLIALTEVEDDSTLVALTQRSVMRTANYLYLRTHGRDRRGINVALLYQPFRFRPIRTREVEIPLCLEAQTDESRSSRKRGQKSTFTPTRNLLYVAGETIGGDTLHIIVCHLPSQASGTRKADRHRLQAAQTLRLLIDSVMQSTPNAPIVVTGDFNADYPSTVLRLIMQPRSMPGSEDVEIQSQGICAGSALRHIPSDHEGTYRYRGDWSHLDHIFVSQSILADTAHIVRLPWLLEPNRTVGGVQPRRTFRGPCYHGGLSDHLPLLLRLRVTGSHCHTR